MKTELSLADLQQGAMTIGDRILYSSSKTGEFTKKLIKS